MFRCHDRPPSVGAASASGRPSAESGYSLVELVITIGMILIITTLAMPSILSYYQSASVRAGAQTVSAVLNQGRQLAIKTNGPVAVCISTGLRFRQTNCSGTAIAVTGLTNSSNDIPLPAGITLSTTGNATFSNLGNATTAGTYTVTDTASGRTLTVTVAASGRITIP
jgi:type IV fimbrial biogenesis protein FimT